MIGITLSSGTMNQDPDARRAGSFHARCQQNKVLSHRQVQPWVMQFRGVKIAAVECGTITALTAITLFLLGIRPARVPGIFRRGAFYRHFFTSRLYPPVTTGKATRNRRLALCTGVIAQHDLGFRKHFPVQLAHIRSAAMGVISFSRSETARSASCSFGRMSDTRSATSRLMESSTRMKSRFFM